MSHATFPEVVVTILRAVGALVDAVRCNSPCTWRNDVVLFRHVHDALHGTTWTPPGRVSMITVCHGAHDGRPSGVDVINGSMRAAQFDAYGSAREVLRVLDNAEVPQPAAGEILVRVVASSVNPIDCAVRGGYGRAYFELRTGQRPPMRPGRDVAGEVVAVGSGVADFSAGDPVYAATLGNANAQYLVVPEAWAAPKPVSLSFTEAASLPYVALTTWTALVTHAGLTPQNAAGRRVVVPRAAGGVGSFATQLIKAWDGEVVAICSTRNVALARSLGADIVIDYTQQDPRGRLGDVDIAFDTSFETESLLLESLKVGADAAYVGIVTPKLKLIDEHGLEDGLRLGDELFARRVAAQGALGRRYYWSFAQPDGAALRQIGQLVDTGRVRPIIDRTFELHRIVEAHEYCESGRAQGKIVVKIAHESD
jgi:reticulon-4-interacting protein 1, mitochondrial